MLNRQKGKRFVSTRWNRVHESISGLSNRKYERRINSSWVYWTTLWTVRQPIQWQSCVNKPICNGCKTNLLHEKINMLFAGLGQSVWWKTVTAAVKMLPEAAGRGQHFQALGHSFSPYGPPSRQITYMYNPFCAISTQLWTTIENSLIMYYAFL